MRYGEIDEKQRIGGEVQERGDDRGDREAEGGRLKRSRVVTQLVLGVIRVGYTLSILNTMSVNNNRISK
ncbi:hypothetical protein HN51_005208 [Arachis hypogaea]